MLIQTFIESAITRGDLFPMRPALAKENVVRHFFAAPDVYQALMGTSSVDEEMQVRYIRARAAVDAYIAGQVIAVRLPPSKDVTALLAQLDDAAEEVWEFRPREPRPGIRIFGRFSERDVFIATHLALKEDLTAVGAYAPHFSRCKQKWGTIFAVLEPHRGRIADDYISDCYPV